MRAGKLILKILLILSKTVTLLLTMGPGDAEADIQAVRIEQVTAKIHFCSRIIGEYISFLLTQSAARQELQE